MAPEILETPALLSDVTADVVVLTWADAEWAATDHVFCSSSQAMPRSRSESGNFPGWVKGYASMSNSTGSWTYRGYFWRVRVGETTVLLYKSNAHCAHQGAATFKDLVIRSRR